MHEGTCVNCGEETLVDDIFEFCEICTAEDEQDSFPYDMG